MSKDNPVFVYGAVYADRDDADADYDTLLDLHSADLVGTYDVALVYKDDDGKVHVTKHEKPTQHGAWTGAAVGALVGIVFPPAILGSALVGAAAGGGIGHAMGGMSRSDAKELGDYLDYGPGRAGRDRRVAPSGAARQGAHARGEDPREGNQRRRQGTREGTRRAPRLAAISSSPARSRTALVAARERPGTFHIRRRTTESRRRFPRWLSRSRVQALEARHMHNKPRISDALTLISKAVK